MKCELPKPTTDMNSQLGQIAGKLKKLEMFLHQPDFGTSKEVLANMMEEDFWEVGASGNRYDKDMVLKVLEERCIDAKRKNWEVKDFECKELSENIYLVTYTLAQADRRATQRSSIWKKYEQNWKIIYHQGTIV